MHEYADFHNSVIFFILLKLMFITSRQPQLGLKPFEKLEIVSGYFLTSTE